MKKFIYFILVFTFLSASSFSLQAQRKKSNKLFKIEKLNLKVVSYPWANELRLSVRILAKSFLEGAKLTFTIRYEKRKVTDYSVTVKKSIKNNKAIYYAEEEMEPINRASQEVLLGNYSIEVFLILDKQRKEFLKKWTNISTRQKYSIGKKTIPFGSKEKIKKEQERLKNFYIERMKNLNNLYKKIIKKRRTEFTNQNFAKKKWRSWFYNEYLAKINEEKKILTSHRERIYYPLYEYTLKAMETYANLLIRIGKSSSMVLYKRHNLSQDSSSIGGVDSFALTKLKYLDQTIERIHQNSARELGISLQQELGYIPPPR